ncbi:MAG: hypothetical protein ACI8QZ_002069 [Chlamydiales bacterium]|jgi:hypothetical protein
MRNTPSMMANLDTEVFFRDYKEVDGIWVAMTIHSIMTSADMGEGSQTWIFSKIEHNTNISESLFELPEELTEAQPAKPVQRTH